MPQIDVQTFPSQIFWVLVSWGIVFLFVAFWVTPRVRAVLEARKARIQAVEDEVADLQSQVEALKKQSETLTSEARSKMEKVMEDAEKRIDEERRDFDRRLHHEVAQRVEAHTRVMEKEKKKVFDSIMSRVEDAAAMCSEKIEFSSQDEDLESFLSGISIKSKKEQ